MAIFNKKLGCRKETCDCCVGQFWSNVTAWETIFCGQYRWAQIYFVLSQSTRLTDKQTDGLTDGRTERLW